VFFGDNNDEPQVPGYDFLIIIGTPVTVSIIIVQNYPYKNKKNAKVKISRSFIYS
jgi:hypothetical protein